MVQKSEFERKEGKKRQVASISNVCESTRLKSKKKVQEEEETLETDSGMSSGVRKFVFYHELDCRLQRHFPPIDVDAGLGTLHLDRHGRCARPPNLSPRAQRLLIFGNRLQTSSIPLSLSFVRTLFFLFVMSPGVPVGMYHARTCMESGNG